MEEMIKVEYMLNGEKKIMNVKGCVSYHTLTGIAQAIVADVVSDQGEYKPWRKDILLVLNVLLHYTDFELPEDWTDNKLFDFYRQNLVAFEKIEAHINDLPLLEEWIDKAIAYRKECYKPNTFGRFLTQLSTVFEQAKKVLEENPALAYSAEDLLAEIFGGEENSEPFM